VLAHARKERTTLCGHDAVCTKMIEGLLYVFALDEGECFKYCVNKEVPFFGLAAMHKVALEFLLVFFFYL
jgi:hypothetical protein